jgi:hypothetical protein
MSTMLINVAQRAPSHVAAGLCRKPLFPGACKLMKLMSFGTRAQPMQKTADFRMHHRQHWSDLKRSSTAPSERG